MMEGSCSNWMAIDRFSRTSLHSAASDGDVDQVENLLMMNPDLIDSVDFDGMTALHYAAQNGHDEIVALLLDASPNLITAMNIDQMTALHYAAQNGHEEVMAELLTTAHPDLVAASDVLGCTALHAAASNNHGRVIAQLLAASPKLGLKCTRADKTALHLAAFEGHAAAVAQLLAATSSGSFVPSVDVNAFDNSGWTALHGAVYNGHEAVVELIQATGGNVVVLDRSRNTLLHSAIQGHMRNNNKGKRTASYKRLIKQMYELRPWSLHTANIQQFTPFHVALATGDDYAIEFLQWKLSLDEIARALEVTRRDFTRFEPIVVEHLEENLIVVLHADMVTMVLEFLGLHAPTISSSSSEEEEEEEVTFVV